MLRSRRPADNFQRRTSGENSQDDDDDQDMDLDHHYDSGYESDPIERYIDITRWQKRLRNVQRRLHQVKEEIAAGALPNPQGGESERKPRRRPIETVKAAQEKVAMKLREGPKKVVGTMRERHQIFQERYQRQMQGLKGRLDQSLSKVRSSKARQVRHMVCFVCSMCDLVVMAVWLGASPWTLHWYYTLKCAGLIGIRALWYRWHGWHYFLTDLCYFSNLMVMLYIWILPSSEALFEAVYGLSGVLLLSVPVFRNSFVPHSLDRITSVQIHISPVLQLWVLRWYSHERPVWWSDRWSERCLADTLITRAGPCVFRIPNDFSIVPVLSLYLVWLCGYCFNQFLWNRKVIEREGYETLYTHMAYDLGILRRLPRRLQGPCASRAVFVAGHFLLFCAGLPCVHAPFLLHTFLMCAAMVWCFKNGATFYITYFWRVYETQIHAFERQMAEASAGSQNNAAPQSLEKEQSLSPCSIHSSESPKASSEKMANLDEEDNDTGRPKITAAADF